MRPAHGGPFKGSNRDPWPTECGVLNTPLSIPFFIIKLRPLFGSLYGTTAVEVSLLKIIVFFSIYDYIYIYIDEDLNHL